MEIAARTERPTGELRQRKAWHHVRPIAISTFYLALYLGVAWGMKALGSSSAFGHWHLAAGLGFGLLLMYGLGYVPLVLAAGLICHLWVFQSMASLPLAAANCVILTLVLAGAARLLRRAVSGSFVSLKYGPDVVRFMITAGLASTALAAAAAANLFISGPAQWQGIVSA